MSDRYLPTPLRRALEKAVRQARDVAEEGARDAIQRLGVADGKAPPYLNDAEKDLRRRLRAHARALGNGFDRAAETQETKRLVEATAYAHWHRMLFARFLAERDLLRHPQHDVPVTLADCRELAEEEGLPDGWAVAERYAAAMLPGVFRLDDPVLAVEFDPVHTQALNRLVTDLDASVFEAEDSLGWTYQFWRAAEKDAVNKSGVKIGADELPAVTQLFTEPYMVRFLLHNTLGAWWAGKVLAADPALAQTAADEIELRAACSLPDYNFEMLRFVREGDDGPWRPAAGTYPGWPKEAKAITMLDPCCGSGHFLTEALAILAALRQAEEHLSPADAIATVLRDNLHGLEIDGRCVQIAAFAVALTAWRIGGWQTLPLPHIAWVGAPPPLPKRDFVALADGDAELEYALAALHDLFAQAPVLGTLLEPAGGDLFEAEKLRMIERLLTPLLAKARKAEPEQVEGVVAARGMADAAALLHRTYVLQSTNVPYLGRGKQDQALADYISRRFEAAKADLASAMIARMRGLASKGGTYCAVTPQSWTFLGSYQLFRIQILDQQKLDFMCALGSKAFETISGEVVNTVLVSISNHNPTSDAVFIGIDCNNEESATEKQINLKLGRTSELKQSQQIKNPDARIILGEFNSGRLLETFAQSYQGIKTGDDPRYRRVFWEPLLPSDKWRFIQTTVERTKSFGGLDGVVDLSNGGRHIARLQGLGAHGRAGCVVSQMSSLQASIYLGEAFDSNVSALVAIDPKHASAIWEFCASPEYEKLVRRIEPSMKANNAVLAKVPFDIKHWQKVASDRHSNGLPKPISNDPTQWIFHGHPKPAEHGTTLLTALARLGGYRWPAEADPDMRLSDEARAWIAKAAELPAGDNDGLLGVPAVAGEKPLADRLRAYLAAVFGTDWSDALERRLVAEGDEVLDKKQARDGSLEAWLRDRAFRQHCALFGQRPFLWHIWDGLKDGFSVFVHYNRFDQAALRKLTYTMLGDWLARAQAEGNQLRYEKGRELQQKLEKILEGEKPYDIFVRWKSLAQQPLGWDPDLDDGVRQNIRPFIIAGVLTHDLSKILKDKDRGKDVPSAPWYDVFNGERRNDHHTTLAEKRAAREAATKRVEAAK